MTGEQSLNHRIEKEKEPADLKPVYLSESPLASFGMPNDLQIVTDSKKVGNGGTSLQQHFRDLHGRDVELVSERPMEGGKEVEFSDGTKEVVWKGPLLWINYKDGNGMTGAYDSNGCWSEHHWGPKPDDGYAVWTSYSRKLCPDGTETVTGDGGKKGRITEPVKPDGSVEIKSFGPKKSDNYTSVWKNHSETRLWTDGSKDPVPR